MEAPQPKPRKSKSKKKKAKQVTAEDNPGTSANYLEQENPEPNKERFSEEIIAEDVASDDLISPENCVTSEEVESESFDEEAEVAFQSCDTLLNNLDLESDRNGSFLTRSQLNVFDCQLEENNEDSFKSVNQEAPCDTSDIELQEPSLSNAEALQESELINDAELNTEVEQNLYPSLNDEFYENLSNLRLRSISQQSYHNSTKDDLDTLSMQNAEAQLDYIAPSVVDDIAYDYDLRSFEVVDVNHNEAGVDNLSILSDNQTLHHLSLQTLVYDDQYEQKLQSCYQSKCVSPTPSMPTFEELNKEILINELKSYYQNPQLAKNDEFIADFIAMCENPNHELHHLLSRYQNGRQKFLSHSAIIESNISRYSKSNEATWAFVKEKKIETGYCADHMKVTFTETCHKAICHPETLKDVDDSLENIRESCGTPLALLQYNWKIAFYHVEQFMIRLTQSCPPPYTEYVTSYVPGVSVSWDHVNHTGQIRTCISILFHFKRQKMQDEVFAKDIDRWLNILVSILLRVATLLDHRFLLNHLLRCPTGFSFWGNNFLQFAWTDSTNSVKSIIGNPIVDHFFLMYSTMLFPLEERDKMLANYEPPIQDSDPSEWAILDELGEVDCDGKQLLERDYLELLGQFNFGMFYRELLKYPTSEEFLKNKHNVSEQEMMTLFSMCLQCISHIKEAFTHLDFTRYRNFCQRNANIMTTFMRFVSDYYHFYDSYGGACSMTDDIDHSKLANIHNYVIEEGFRCLAETSNVSLWQFLTDLPYHRISVKVLWKLYGFLHQVNPEKHIKTQLKSASPYDIVTKLYKTARFQRRIESLSDDDCTFMVNVFCKMALSRDVVENFVKVIALDIYHIGVTSNVDKQSTDHACKNCLSTIIDHCPEVVSVIINNIDKPTLKDLPNNLKIFKGLSLQSWLPSDDDFNLLTTWLKTTPVTSLTNQLSRVIIKGLNWGSHNGKLFIPCEYHRKMAVDIVAAHSYHLPDRAGYLIHSSSPDFAKHVSNSDKNQFVCWCWETLLTLCLHKTELMEHDGLTLKFNRQQSRQLRKQRSESQVPTTDSSPTNGRNKLIKQQSTASTLSTTSATPVTNEGEASVGVYLGSWGRFPYKMRKEAGLASLCEALRTSGEMAAFVALSITTIGHTIVDFQADGIQLMLLLQKSTGYHYRALLQVLSNILTITLRSKCLHLLLTLPDFLPLVQNLARAEHSGAFNGRTSKPFSGYIVNKLTAAYNTGQDEGNQCLKFWTDLFFSIPNFHSDIAIVSILDKVCSVVFCHHGDEMFLIGEMREYLNKCAEASKRNSSKILSNLVSWFSNVGLVSSLLQSLSSPGDVFYWSYYVTYMECAPQLNTGFFQTLTEVLFTNPDMTIDVAFRKAMSLVECEEISSLTIANIAIYRWGSLLQTVAMDHPLLPYAWRQFFKLYFHRITPEMAGVGFRYYQGMFQVRDLRAMKQRLTDTSHHFELDETEEEITEDMLFKSKLSHFFMSLSLWTDETRLHEANLFVPGLPQQYNGSKLDDILQGREVPWDDMVDMNKLLLDISNLCADWTRYSGRKYSPRNCSKPEETPSSLVDLLYSYVSKNMCDSAPPPDLVMLQSNIPIGPDLSQAPQCGLDDLTLLNIVGPYFGKLKQHAERFVELTTTLQNLDEAYLEDVPNRFYNRNSQRVEMVTCYSRIGALGRCSGPAMINVSSCQWFENTPVQESLAENRTNYEDTLEKCRQELEDDICVTAIFLERIVSDLYRSAGHTQELGRKLFYHVVDHLTSAVWKYPPSQQIFAFSIDCLGQFFIRNNPEETLPLLNFILHKKEFATSLAPLFQPNQGFHNFVNVYNHVIVSLTRCEPEIGFTVLSKFDIRSWLATQHSTSENSKQLINAIFSGFDIYPYSAEDSTFLMFYDTLKLHLKHVLTNRLCSLLQYTIEKTLEISSKHSHHQQIWRDILELLETEGAQEMLTLNTCHRILYELSKYFLQFKKSILTSTEHDLYTHWSSYTDNLVHLFRIMSAVYINKASYLAPTEEQADCIFMITCTVFAPWILVYEEACLPWSSPHTECAGEMLTTFTSMLKLMNELITDVTPLLNRFWWYYMDILGHPIVPGDIIDIYFEHFKTLPWIKFVPTLDILHSLLKCVRNNRKNINFVIFVMTQVNWQTVVGELKKESHAFDMLVDVLITFALDPDIFRQFGQEFTGLFRQFKSLNLSLVSDQGFSSIMSRIDKTVRRSQYIEPLTNTGHLVQFMGVLCRFPQLGVSYVKQITYFQHVVNIITKISNAQYAETLVQSLLYNVEQVFYTGCTEQHIADLGGQLFRLFNTTPCDASTHSVAVKKIEAALKMHGSIKEGFSFAQLSLYYLSVLTSTVHNVKMQAVVCEVLIESYFTHCESGMPVLSVSWTTLNERFLISHMTYDNFINHSVQESCPLNIYLYTTHLLAQAEDVDGSYSAVANLVDCSSKIIPKPKEEQKMLLLWFKIFDIMIQLHENGIRSSAISSIIKQLPTTMLKLAEDRETGGLFNNWFGKKSKFSLEFRLTTRILATYVLHQINKDGALRLSGGTRHNLTSEAGKAMDNIRTLVSNKAYAAHIPTLQHCISMILDSSRTFLHTIELLRFLAGTFYDDKPYLSAIMCPQRKSLS